MGDAAEPPLPPALMPSPPLGHIARGGFITTITLTLAVRAVSMLSQIALARLLVPNDYGVVSVALAMTIVPNLLRDAGAGQILVQRQGEFEKYANAAFWLTLTLGMVGGIMTAIAAPIVARLYHAPELLPLMLVLALISPLNALNTVPAARMQIALKLRTLATLNSIAAILTSGLGVLFASLGLGPMSIILPMVVVAALRVPVFWVIGMSSVRRLPEVALWRFFLNDGIFLVLTALCWSITAQGDYAILGHFTSKDQVGYYYFASNLSMQSVQLLSTSLSGILFPTLSKLRQEPIRQRDAFIRACRATVAITVPVSLLPITCAGPLIEALFGQKWLPAAPLLQVLCLASAMASIALPASSFLSAQGRNKTALLHSITMAVSFVLIVVIGSKFFGAMGASIAATVFQVICSGGFLYLALRPFDRAFVEVLKVCRIPFVCSLLSLALAITAVEALKAMTIHKLIIIVVGLTTQITTNGVLLHSFYPLVFTDYMTRLRVFRTRSIFGLFINPSYVGRPREDAL